MGDTSEGRVVGEMCVGEIGEGSGSLASGLRVLVHPTRPCRRCVRCRAGADGACADAKRRGRDVDGLTAEAVVADRQDVSAVPSTLADAEALAAARLLAAPVAAIERYELARRPTAVVVGVDSEEGLAATHVLASLGWQVIVVGSDEGRRAAAGSAGASVAVDSRTFPRFSDATLDVTEGRGAPLIVDATGDGQTISEGLRGRATRSDLVLLGGDSPRLEVPAGVTVARPIRPGAAERNAALRFAGTHGIPPLLSSRPVPMEEMEGRSAATAGDTLVLVPVGEGPPAGVETFASNG